MNNTRERGGRSKYEVLVAEVDEGQQQLVDLLLADPQIRPVFVSSGRAALEHLRTHTPDLVIAGADLPDLDGFGVCSRLKRVVRLSAVPVIVTTDSEAGLGISPRLRQRASEALVDLLLPRPLGDKNLKERALRLMQPGAEVNSHLRLGNEHRAVHNTLVIDEAIDNIARERQVPHHGSGASTSSAATASSAAPVAASTAHSTANTAASYTNGTAARADLEHLRRENEALRLEVAVLREKTEELKRQLNESRRVGRGARQ